MPSFLKSRSDKGRSKVIPPELITKACDLKLELPSRPISSIIDILERCEQVAHGALKPSTLSRALASQGLSGRSLKEKQAFRRYMAEFPNDTWQSDQYNGPYIPDSQNSDKKVKTQLFVFLDDCSRLLCHGQFYLDGWMEYIEKIRFASDDEIRKVFLFKEDRMVSKARTIKLLSNYYETLPVLVNKKVWR
jgi:putative transposase